MASLTRVRSTAAAASDQAVPAVPADPAAPAGPPAPPPGADAVPLGRYARFLRGQWPVVLAAMALGGALGAVRSATVQHTYTSTVTVLAPPIALEPGLPPLDQGPFAPVNVKPELSTLDTDAQLIKSGLVLESLKGVHGFNVPADRLGDRVTISASPNTRVLTIGVRANSPGNARAGARAVANAFLKVHTRVIGHVQTRNRQTINRRIAILQAELKALPSDPDAQARLDVHTRREAILKQMADTQAQLGFRDQYAEVLRSPDRPGHPDDPDSDVNATSGLGLGLLGGLLAGLVRERRPRRLRRVRDVRRRIALPLLTDVGREGVADAGRRLRNLAFAEDARTVLVTGMPAETADPVAVGVAAAFAYGGAPTTLLRVGGTGVPTYRDAGGERDEGMAAFRVEAVTSVGDDRDLIAAVSRSREGAGVVVISGPPLASAAAVTLAAVADVTFVTVKLKHVTDRQLIAAVQDLDKAGAPPRGVVTT